MKKVKSGSDISFNFNVKVTDKTTVDEIIREASELIKVRFAEYKVEPEESEDERIMRVIGLALTDVPEERFASLGTTLKDCLTYLEKQKENPKSADSIPEDCTSDAKYENWWHKTANSLPDNGRDVLAKDALGNYLLASFDGAQWFISVYDGEDHHVLHTPPILEWCEIHSEKQKEQKPAEWSEEDEKLLDLWLDVIDRNDWRMDEDFCKASREFINKLKSLCPPKGWKEGWCEDCKVRYNHWKPSEEQMEILGRFNDPVLKSLYSDLKKLL